MECVYFSFLTENIQRFELASNFRPKYSLWYTHVRGVLNFLALIRGRIKLEKLRYYNSLIMQCIFLRARMKLLIHLWPTYNQQQCNTFKIDCINLNSFIGLFELGVIIKILRYSFSVFKGTPDVWAMSQVATRQYECFDVQYQAMHQPSPRGLYFTKFVLKIFIS